MILDLAFRAPIIIPGPLVHPYPLSILVATREGDKLEKQPWLRPVLVPEHTCATPGDFPLYRLTPDMTLSKAEYLANLEVSCWPICRETASYYVLGMSIGFEPEERASNPFMRLTVRVGDRVFPFLLHRDPAQELAPTPEPGPEIWALLQQRRGKRCAST